MSSLRIHDFQEFHEKLEVLNIDVRNKSIALAIGIMSVYGFQKEIALEEGIRRAKEFYEKKALEEKNNKFSTKLILLFKDFSERIMKRSRGYYSDF